MYGGTGYSSTCDAEEGGGSDSTTALLLSYVCGSMYKNIFWNHGYFILVFCFIIKYSTSKYYVLLRINYKN